MILKSLQLTNYRKYKNTNVKFPEGVTGILGPNGTGKTTLVEAIVWALFGHRAARTKKEDIKRIGASLEEPCTVNLEFELGRDRMSVTRSMTKGLLPEGSICVNGEEVVRDSEAMASYIERKLGLDYQAFFTSIFARQKELATLSQLRSSERKKLILRLLGIERIEDSVASIRRDLRDKTEEIKGIDLALFKNGVEQLPMIRWQRVDLEIEEKVIIDALEQFRVEKSELVGRVKKLQKQLQLAEGGRTSWLEQKTRFAETELELKGLESRVDRARRVLQGCGKAKSLRGKKSVERKIESIEDRKDVLSTEKGSLLANSKQLEEGLNELRLSCGVLEKEGSRGKCPTCRRPLGKYYERLLEEMRKEDGELSHELGSISARLIEVKSELVDLERLSADLEVKRVELSKIEVETARVKEIQKNLRELQSQEEEVRKKRDMIEEGLKALSFSEEEYQSSKTSCEREEERLHEIELMYVGKKGELESIHKEIVAAGERIRDLETLTERKKEVGVLVQDLSLLEKAMKDFQIYMIGRVRPLLSSYGSRILSTLTDGRYNRLDLTEDYDILVMDQGRSFSLNRFSGGEEDLANLSLRLAISSLLSERSSVQVNFLVLDEIFGSQDSDRRQSVLGTLKALTKRFRQVFLITHVEDVTADLDYVLKVTEDEDGVSSVTA